MDEILWSGRYFIKKKKFFFYIFIKGKFKKKLIIFYLICRLYKLRIFERREGFC